MPFWRYFQIPIISIILFIGKSESTVDFSQFYLPPCCFPAAISRLPHPYEPLYPSPTENHHQNEINYRKDTLQPEQSKIVEQILSLKVINGTDTTARNKSDSIESYKGKIFKYLIPLNTIIPEENHESEDNDNNEKFTEIKLLNDNEFIEKNQSHQQQQSLQKFKRFIDFSDLTPEEKGKRISFIQKVLNRKPGWKFPDEIAENQNANKNDANTNIKSRYEVLNSVPLLVQKPENPLQSNDDYDYSSKIDPRNVQPVKSQKMPSSWLMYLKRALFQSMIADKEKKNGAFSTTTDEDLSKSSSNNILISNEGPNAQTKQLWDKILHAKLMTIDPLTKTASEIPELIYLPPDQVASGLVVNTENGIEFRISPELYQNQNNYHHHTITNNLLNLRQEAKEECNCHLINHGDILVAYWSVSRILNEQNQPSLQYLLHPVQHNVPTPPLLFPFGEGIKSINPSPIDTFFHPHQQFLYNHGHNHNHDHYLQNVKPIVGLKFRNSKSLHLHQNQHQQHPQNYIVNNPNSIHQHQVQHQHQHQQINQLHHQQNHFVQFPNNIQNQRIIIETKHGVTPILLHNNLNLYRNIFENNLRREDAIITEKVLHDLHRHHHHHQQNLVPPPASLPPPLPIHIQHQHHLNHPYPSPVPPPIPQYHLQSHHHNHDLPPPPLPPRLNHPKSIQEIISPGNQILLPPPIPYENNNLPHPLGIYGHNYGHYIEKPSIHQHDFDIQAKNHDKTNANGKKVQNEMKTKGSISTTYNNNQQLQKKNMVNEPSYILDF